MSDILQQDSSERGTVCKRERVRVDGIIGESPAIHTLLGKVAIVARTRSPVLLRGESGTGKELIAKALHQMSSRVNGPFIKVNCAALPESVLESELFGHEKGAFTNAVRARNGRFELADKGTLFLDEIGTISLGFQAKLLRVLQEQEFERVGGSTTVKVNVRIVAATNRNLEDAVASKEFRADLYYRLNVVPIWLPPLRERPGDIALLAANILDTFNKENQRALTLETSSFAVLEGCAFPGNVRELENCVRRTATLAAGPTILGADFACRHGECLSRRLWDNTMDASPRSPGRLAAAVVRTEPLGELRMSERERLIEALERAGWVQTKAARLLGTTPRKVAYALKRLKIEVKRF